MSNKPEPFVGDSLTGARGYVTDHCKKGVDCPCCGKYVKQYARHIHTGMALVLVELHKYFLANPQKEWLNIADFPTGDRFNINGNYSMLRYWGLLDPHPETPGLWRITEMGHQFATGEIRVAKTIWLLNNSLVATSKQTIDINDALRTKSNSGEGEEAAA